jgi:hypothetical protein
MRQKFHGPDEGLGSSIAILVGTFGAFALTFGFIVSLMVRGDHYANAGVAAYTPPPGTVLIPPISGKPLKPEDLPVASSNQPRQEVATKDATTKAPTTEGETAASPGDQARRAQASAHDDETANTLRKLAHDPDSAAPVPPGRQAQSGTALLFDRMSAAN